MFSQALRSTPAIAASQFRLDVEKLWEDLSPERVVHDATIDLDEDIDEDAALAYKWDRHNSSNLFEALGQVTRDMVSLAVQSESCGCPCLPDAVVILMVLSLYFFSTYHIAPPDHRPSQPAAHDGFLPQSVASTDHRSQQRRSPCTFCPHVHGVASDTVRERDAAGHDTA